MNFGKKFIMLFLMLILMSPIGVSAKAIDTINDSQQYIEAGKLFNNTILLEDPATQTTVNWDLCSNPKSLSVFKFIGNLLKVGFIAIPILLIIIGSIDFLKAVAANKDDDIKKAQNAFVKRIIAAIVVFLVPLIVSIVMNIFKDETNIDVKSNCLTCILNPDTCVTQ